MARILIIDDEPPLRMLIKGILTPAGHTVIEAANGLEGIAQYKTHQPDLVICDIIMPEMEGIETISRLRAEDSNTPILAISGNSLYGPVDYLQVAVKIGADEALKKPIRYDTLMEAVTKLLPDANPN